MSLNDYPRDSSSAPVPVQAPPPGLPTFEDRVEMLGGLVRRIVSRASFWTVVPAVTLLAMVYFYVVADPIYVSESVISIQHKASVGGGFGAMLGNLTGTSSTSNEDAALAAYIVSNDLLEKLDKQFHLREIYASQPHNPLRRLASDASQEKFLAFYRNMVELDVRYDVGLLTVRVLDFDATRARDINMAILSHAESFMNTQSLSMMAASLRFARDELTAAQAAAARAPQMEQDVARLRLQAAQAAFANASSVAGQQQTFVARIASPNLPSTATRPEKLLNTLATAIIASILYAVFMLGMANIRDHGSA